MEGISDHVVDSIGRADVVDKTTDRDDLTRVGILRLFPTTEEGNEEVTAKLLVENLGEEVELRNESTLQDNGHVGCVEQLDGVCSGSTSLLGGLNGEFYSEALEVNNDYEDENCCEEIGDVGQVGAIEGFLKSSDFIATGDQKVEQSNDGTFEFSSATSVDGGGAERLPDNAFANVGSNEEGDTRAKTVTLLKELVQENADNASEEKLDDNKGSSEDTDFSNISVHTRRNVSNSFDNSDNKTKKFLCTVEKDSIFINAFIDFDDFSTRKQLHNKTRSDDRGNTKLHQSTLV